MANMKTFNIGSMRREYVGPLPDG